MVTISLQGVVEVLEEGEEQVAEDELLEEGVRVQHKIVADAGSLITRVESVPRRTTFVHGVVE